MALVDIGVGDYLATNWSAHPDPYINGDSFSGVASGQV